MVAPPNLTLTITPPGGSPSDYTRYLTYAGANQECTITQNFGRQGDTATMVLIDEYATAPNFYIPVLSQISLQDNYAGTNLFAGVVTAPKLVVTGPNRNEWSLACTDYTFYADNSKPVFGTFNGQTLDQVAISLTAQANCGITAVSTAAGGFVAPAPAVSTISFNYTSLSSAWRTLAQLASQSAPYGWYVDQNLAFHFFNPTTALNSGVTFTTTPTTSGSLVEGHIYLDSNFGYTWDGTTIHNLILVQGSTQTIQQPNTGAATDTWLSNGVQPSWPLKYTPANVVQLTVGGVQVSNITMLNPGTSAQAGQTWTVGQNANGQWFLNTTSVPGSGTSIKLWYNYLQPVIAQASDAASQAAYTGPNHGIFGEYINDTTLTTVQMALARALRERTEYAFAAERVTFTTSEDWLGYIRAGQTFQFVNRFIPDSNNSYTYGINDQFIVIANTVNFVQGGYRQMNITAVRV